MTRVGRIHTGIGSLGWTKNFNWSEVNTIREEKYSSSDNGGDRRRLVLEGGRRIAFASMLNDERRYYMLKALKKMLAVREY